MQETLQQRTVSMAAAEPKTATVAVVIVCYNQARFLREAIESVQAQTVTPHEVWVIDDGSTDETAAVAAAFPEVEYVWQKNRGLSAARNTGLRFASSEYVVFLDADDRLLPNAIRAGLDSCARHPECAFTFGAFRNILADGSPGDPPPNEGQVTDPYLGLLQGNFIGMHGTVLYRRTAIEAAGGFDESLPACEDYQLYLRLARQWPVTQHGELVAEYRQHEANMSRDYALMLRTVLAVLRAERPLLRDRCHRRALRAGIRAWRDYYGSRMLAGWKSRRTLRGLWQLLRADPRGVARWVVRGIVRRTSLSKPVRFGSLRRLEPFSRCFGFDRGQPIDRYYVERFLSAHQSAIRGHVLEVGDDMYSRLFGGGRITRQDVLHVKPGQPGSTITADLANAPDMPLAVFDCIILTQTLHFIFDTSSAIATLHRILKPGGVLLATLPGISPICRDQEDLESDCWRFTANSARRLFVSRFGGSNVQVETYGNVLSAFGFLEGLASHELRPAELDHHDPDFQVTIAVTATKGREVR